MAWPRGEAGGEFQESGGALQRRDSGGRLINTGLPSAEGSSQAGTLTATADGTGTGAITQATQRGYYTVTSGNSAHIVTLPAPVVGKEVILDVGANGFKLQTTAPATIGINGGTGASAKSTIAANSTCFLICVSATSWKGYFLDADSDVAKVAAAA